MGFTRDFGSAKSVTKKQRWTLNEAIGGSIIRKIHLVRL